MKILDYLAKLNRQLNLLVESVTDSISINTWVELKPEDDFCRLKEIASKILVQGIMESNFVSFEKWMNSSEVYLY